MLGLIQRVTQANVKVNGETISEIGLGVLLLLGMEKGDTRGQADKLLHKVLNYRIFSDPQGKMNLSIQDIEGSLLVVSQFTLTASTDKGLRPSFSSALPPDEAHFLYSYFVEVACRDYDPVKVATGRFGTDMKVSLVNDGPVTFLLKS